MRRFLISTALLLAGMLLTGCDQGPQEIAPIVINVDPEQTESGCTGKDQIVGGSTTITVTPEDSDVRGIDRIEFLVNDSLIHTAEASPFEFTIDTTQYEEDAILTVRANAYDSSDTLRRSDTVRLLVENSADPMLRSLAEASSIYIGAPIMAADDFTIPWDDRLYIERICQNFSLLVADYGMYMINLQPSRDVWHWSGADSVVQFAEDNGMRIRGQALVWGINLRWTNQGEEADTTPAWVYYGDRSREEMIDIMYSHIDTVMNRYKGRIQEWVVVNEPVDGTQPGELAPNVWTEGIGDDYIELAFRRARQADPEAVLIINEFEADYLGQAVPEQPYKVDNYYNLVAGLLERGTPIDAVGFQFHLWVGRDNPTVEDIVSNFDRYADLGLDVHVTEMDVVIEEPVTQEDLEEQARLYVTVLQACLESAACKSFTVWGHSDKHTYTLAPGWGAPYLFDEAVQPKPAFYSVLDLMETYSQ